MNYFHHILKRDLKMSTTILLIRHGETAWNRAKIFRGRHDIPLNENGRAQARLVAKALSSVRIEASYTSPLSRATETASLALKSHHITAISDAGLTDIDYGDWTGLEEGEVARRWPKEYACWISKPHMGQVPGGETLQQVMDRAFSSLKSITEKHNGQTVALFSHRIVNKVLVLSMLSLGLERFPFVRQDNCAINEFEQTNGSYITVRLNDTCHIRQSGKEVLSADF